MISLFLLFVLFEVSDACSSPGYEVLYRGQCFRPAKDYYLSQNGYDGLKKECAEDEAFPPIFEMETDISQFIQMAPNWKDIDVISGLTCNLPNGKYIWLNGAPLTYFNRFHENYPENCTADWAHFDFYKEKFYSGFYPGSISQNFCQEPAFIGKFLLFYTWKILHFVDAYCGNFEHYRFNNEDNSTCIKIFSKPRNWTDAEAFCKARGSTLAGIHSKQMNDYIRRSAVGLGLKDGILIGLSNGFGGFGWIDGSPLDYTNYEHGYPNSFYGNCGLMSTALGKWVNVDCSLSLPFACTKPPLASSLISNTCEDIEYKDGDHASMNIYSPGFPETADDFCDYFLEAPAGKVVEFELVFLEANKCCDALILEDSTVGGKMIANLTGYTTEAKVYRSTTPYMFVHWRPANGEGIRGFHAIFRVV